MKSESSAGHHHRQRGSWLNRLASVGCAALLAACAAAPGRPGDTATALEYTSVTRGLAALPASERNLPTVTAEPYFKVSDKAFAIEGPSFDRQGNLLFVDIYGGRLLRLSPKLELSTVYTDNKLTPAGVAIHRDGRVFLAGVGDFKTGAVVAVDPDGRNPTTIIAPGAGYVPDDLVFDDRGGFYFTDFKGSATSPTGGVYYVTPDFKTTTPILPNMAMANGVALSPDDKTLWATEFSAGRLHRVDLTGPGAIAHFGTSTPYQFVGRSPDSMRTDADGNIYVAIYHQARILVLNPTGVPIGQILIPGREGHHFLKTTSLAFKPGTRELYIVARDELGDRGTMIFRARGFADGSALFSHR
jgi:lactonase